MFRPWLPTLNARLLKRGAAPEELLSERLGNTFDSLCLMNLISRAPNNEKCHFLWRVMACINLSPKRREIFRLTFSETHLKPVIIDAAAAANIATAHWHTNTVWANSADEIRQLILARLGAVAPALQPHLFFGCKLVISGACCQPSESQRSPRLQPPVTGELQRREAAQRKYF